MVTWRIKSPLDKDTVKKLKAGDNVLISGVIYAARDAAHKRLIAALDKGEKLPFEIQGQTVYYMGPSPAKPGQVIGAAGPTTSGRMDIYTPLLLAAGVRTLIGKGNRSVEVRQALQKNEAVYLSAVGGAGALIARSIKKSELIAYPELGPEAVLKLIVVDFPAIVANDVYGNDIYEQGMITYSRNE